MPKSYVRNYSGIMPVNWSFLVGGHLASGFWTESLPGPESLILMSRFPGSTPLRSMQTPCRPDKRILQDSAFPTSKEGSRPSPAAAAEEVAVLLRGAVWIHHLFFGHRARRGNKRLYKPTDLEWSSFLPLSPPDTLVYQEMQTRVPWPGRVSAPAHSGPSFISRVLIWNSVPGHRSTGYLFGRGVNSHDGLRLFSTLATGVY